MSNLVRSYIGSGILPKRPTGKEVNLPVGLPAGVSYPAGQMLGQVVGNGTAVNDVQTLTVTGTPSSGTITLGVNGYPVTVLYNETSANLQTKLAAVPGIGTGNVTVTGGGALPGNAQTITFVGDCGGLEQPIITVISNGLGGGSSPAGSIAHTTPGNSANGHYKAYDDNNSDGSETAKAVLQFPCAVDLQGNVTFGDTAGAADNGLTAGVAPAWFTGIFDTSELTGIDAAAVADLGRILSGSTATLATAGTLLSIS